MCPALVTLVGGHSSPSPECEIEGKDGDEEGEELMTTSPPPPLLPSLSHLSCLSLSPFPPSLPGDWRDAWRKNRRVAEGNRILR